MLWFLIALLSAFFAGITTILAKCGIKHTNLNLATAVRTFVTLIFSWIIVIISGNIGTIRFITVWELLCLLLSGLVTGISWILYFKALSIGEVNKVVAVDKFSVVLSMLFTIAIFNETQNIVVKLTSIILIFVGTLFMIDKKNSKNKKNKSWIIYAFLSAIFAAMTSIFGKFGIDNIDSNLGTAIRTIVVLIISWSIVFATKEYRELKYINKKELTFICLSGIATGASWLCYYYAIKYGIVSVVIPIDKLSIIIPIIFSYILFKEKLNKKSLSGLILIIIGTILMTISS